MDLPRPFARLVLALLSAFALAAPAPAQQRLPTPQPVEAVPAPATARPALWKVADADTTIYLFGTVHLLPPEIEWLDGRVAQALDGSDQLVTEIPEVADSQRDGVILRYGVLPKGQSLRKLMTRAEQAKFARTLKGLGLAPYALDRYRPWFAAVTLATLPLAQKGYTRYHGVEETIAARARELGRPRIGLETLEGQIRMLASFRPATQKRFLFGVVDEVPTIDADMGQIVKAWSTGDAAGLAKLLNEGEDDPEMVPVLFTNRNKAWAQWIKARLNQPGTVFIAVGAGHLGTTGSVQDQLAALGIGTTRVQ